MKPYFYYKGICDLAKILTGKENIYLGIRPYGFHAGNASTMVVYPILLCRELEKLGKTPKFNFYVFINDWEQDSLEGPDIKLYPFNVLPKFTTWQYIKDPIDNNKNIVDYWETVIVNNVRMIKHYFPAVNIISSRNSELKNDPKMKECIIKTIKNPDIILNILKENTDKKILNSPVIFSSAVCRYCHAAKGDTTFNESENIISHKCKVCGRETKGEYEKFDYWLYHKPLALPRIAIFKIDLCITGSDHFYEGDFVVREKLFNAYGINMPLPKTLYAPSIFGSNEMVMGKSKGNAKSIDLDKLINLILENKNRKRIMILNKI